MVPNHVNYYRQGTNILIWVAIVKMISTHHGILLDSIYFFHICKFHFLKIQKTKYFFINIVWDICLFKFCIGKTVGNTCMYTCLKCKCAIQK